MGGLPVARHEIVSCCFPGDYGSFQGICRLVEYFGQCPTVICGRANFHVSLVPTSRLQPMKLHHGLSGLTAPDVRMNDESISPMTLRFLPALLRL